MPWEWGTLASVIVGGLVSGAATLGTAIKRESIVASREANAEAALVRGSARVVSMHVENVALLALALLASGQRWSDVLREEEQALTHLGEDIRRIATAATAEEWRALDGALHALGRVCRLQRMLQDDSEGSSSEVDAEPLETLAARSEAAYRQLERLRGPDSTHTGTAMRRSGSL
jgi:hypothetical protein